MSQKNACPAWLNYLLGLIAILVVAHHSSLPYAPFARFNKVAYSSSTHPIVDTVRWDGIDIFADFNDTFIMSLIFLICGLFSINRLKKGGPEFIRNSFSQLFIPFIAGGTALMLLSLYPAYLVSHGSGNIKNYITDFFTVEHWPAGPPWVLWVLLLFSVVFALLYPHIKTTLYKAGELLNRQKNNPAGVVVLLYVVSWCLYLPLVLWVKPENWKSFGPFDFQVSRGLLYFGYFIIGAIIGSVDFDKGILSADSLLVKLWPLWTVLGLGMYAVLQWVEAPVHAMMEAHPESLIQAKVIYRSVWILSSVLTCVAFLTLLKKTSTRIRPFWESASANAYGIYLIHYLFVVWCQYILLSYQMPAVCKALITFGIAISLSWFISSSLRKLPIVQRYFYF